MPLPSVGPVAQVGPPGLVVAEPRHRGHLEPAVHTRGVHLDVERAGGRVADVAGAQVQDPVGEPQVADGALGPGHDLCVHVGGLRRRAVGQQLDLVELVHPEQATGVLAGRAGLTAEAAGVGHEPPGQVRLVVDLVAAQGGERAPPRWGWPTGRRVPCGTPRRRTWGGGPVDTIVSVRTNVGGRTSSYRSTLRSMASWHRARTRAAPAPRYMTNIEPDSFTARSTSRMPSCSPTSQCGTRWCCEYESASNCSTRTTTLSSSPPPSGQSCAGRLGMRRRRSRSSSVMASARASSSFSSSPSIRLCSCSSAASSWRCSRNSLPTSFDSVRISARSESRWADSRRSSPSSRWTSSTMAVSSPRREIPAFTASGSVRMARTSSMGER